MDSNVFSSEWMVKAIFITLFCCPPIGLVAIVYRTKARKLYYRGRYNSSHDAFSKANRWLKAAIICGIVAWVSLAIVLVLAN